MPDAVVTGAGGFIGGHLVRALLAQGATVRAVDIKPLPAWFQLGGDAENLVGDISDRVTCTRVAEGAADVYHLAADMGGMGFIEGNKAACMLSVLPTTQMLLAARDQGARRFFYSSSACVYAADKQSDPEVRPLKENDVYPAMPEDGYGWEKLFVERMCRHFLEDFGLQTRVARYHNIYGTDGTWSGGREKAPAAICRKVAEAVVSGRHEISIWGDGEQTRSFTYITDCVEGTLRITSDDYADPVNLGSSELVTINELVSIVENIAGVQLKRSYDLDAPQGVRGRNSDNTLIRERYGWEPTTPLVEGLTTTYRWVHEQVAMELAKT